MRRLRTASFIFLMASLCAGCGGGGSQSVTPPANSILIGPLSPSVRANATETFTATVTGVTNPAVTWTVNGVANGNSTVGTIVVTGNLTATYTAPAIVPATNAVTVEATVSSDTSLTYSTEATLLNPIPQVATVSPSPINVGPFTITVTGSGFVSGAVVNFGSLTLTPTSLISTQIVASGTASSGQMGTLAVTVTNPNPGSATSSTYSAQVSGVAPVIADRFIEQSTFGPTPALVAQVQSSGLQAFLTSQFALPVTPYADPAVTETNDSALQQRFFVQILTVPDQLRQRIAFALSQIFVIASDKINTPQAFTPYLNLLQADAFTNYRQIMQDVTLSPAMGHYLDMVNNDKPNTTTGTHADENYAREQMQLFTVGEILLNEDGSAQHDSNNNPIPTYTQDTVEAFARAFTGWTYPTMPGGTLQKHNPAYWTGPMVPFETNHDMNAKTPLLIYSGAAATSLPAGQTAEQDLSQSLDNIFNHPNVPPFVALRLIQHLVTSNPSPAYIQRVADVFKNNGSGVRGDMTAVITAILMDPEARRGDEPATAVATDGHLQEPILFMAGLLRAFNATTDGANLPGQGGNMGQTALDPASVFNFYSPLYVITGTTSKGPEFQILTTATTLARANWVNSYVFGSLGATTTVD